MKSMFDPLIIGNMTAKNSVVRSATAESLATASGRPTSRLFDKYEELARGGVGTIITGYAYVTPDGKPSEGALGIYDDSFADDYRQLTGVAHAHDVRIVLQLVYGGSKSKIARDDPRMLASADQASTGRMPANRQPNVRIAGPSPLENPKTHLVPTEATRDDLASIVNAFGKAAARARNWGFDGVEVHAAHGYLLSQFLSRRFNIRTDEYGGALDNRARFAVECVHAARQAVGETFPILVKMNSCDDYGDPSGVRGGLSEDESAQVCAWLIKAGASAIDVSGDWHAVRGYDATGNPFFADFGARLARNLDVPIIVTGGWRRFDVIARHLACDGIDAIAMGRPLICEPDLVARWLSGNREPSKCVSCNQCGQRPGIPCALRQ